MPVVKQRTASKGNQKQTVVLKKLKNKMDRGGEWMYVIEDKDTGGNIEDPFTNKNKAMREFNQTIKDIERGMESSQSGSGSRVGGDMSFLGDLSQGEDDDGGGPYLPGF